MAYRWRICHFPGTPQPDGPPKREPCGIADCHERATRWALFAWGAAALCPKHFTEETGEKP